MNIRYSFCLSCWLLGCGLVGRPALHGDAREYILQTQAIALRGQFRINPVAAAEYWNRTNPYGLELGETRPAAWPLTESAQAGGGFGALYPDRFGNWRYAHFWLYSAVAAPLYGLLHAVLPRWEYASFRIINSFFLLIPFILAWRKGGSGVLLTIMILASFTPLIPYTDWAHPELFCFATVLASFQLARGRYGRLFAPALLGLAATQNPPILLFFPLLLLHTVTGPDRMSCKRALVAFGAGSLVGLLPIFYSLYCFQTWNIIQAVGLADFRHATLARAAHFFFSPLVGAVWIFPACFLFLPVSIRRSNAFFAAAALLSVFLAAWASSATANFNAGQVGALRYAVWALAPLWFIVFEGARWPTETRARKALFLAAIAVNVLMILTFKYGRLPRKDIRLVAGCRRATPPVAAWVARLRYPDDIEVLVENIVGHEISERAAIRCRLRVEPGTATGRSGSFRAVPWSGSSYWPGQWNPACAWTPARPAACPWSMKGGPPSCASTRKPATRIILSGAIISSRGPTAPCPPTGREPPWLVIR